MCRSRIIRSANPKSSNSNFVFAGDDRFAILEKWVSVHGVKFGRIMLVISDECDLHTIRPIYAVLRKLGIHFQVHTENSYDAQTVLKRYSKDDTLVIYMSFEKTDARNMVKLFNNERHNHIVVSTANNLKHIPRAIRSNVDCVVVGGNCVKSIDLSN
jgi:predicted SpoU family rRNA methylase